MNQTQLKLSMKRVGLRVKHIPLILGDASLFFNHCMDEQTLLMTFMNLTAGLCSLIKWVILSAPSRRII